MKMANSRENLEPHEFIDKLLIDCVKQRPSLYYNDIYSVADEREWDEMQSLFGIQSIAAIFCDFWVDRMKILIKLILFLFRNRIVVEKTMANHSK